MRWFWRGLRGILIVLLAYGCASDLRALPSACADPRIKSLLGDPPLEQRLRSLLSKIGEQFEGGLRDLKGVIPARDYNDLVLIARVQPDYPSLVSKFCNRLSLALSDETIAPVLAWERDGFGKRVRQIELKSEEEFLGPEWQNFLAGLSRSRPSQNRIDLAKKMNDLAHSREDMLLGWERGWMASALFKNALKPIRDQESEDDLLIRREREKIEARTKIYNFSLSHTLFVYRDLSDLEMQKLTEFWSTSAGRSFLDTYWRATNEIFLDEWESRMTTVLGIVHGA